MGNDNHTKMGIFVGAAIAAVIGLLFISSAFWPILAIAAGGGILGGLVGHSVKSEPQVPGPGKPDNSPAKKVAAGEERSQHQERALYNAPYDQWNRATDWYAEDSFRDRVSGSRDGGDRGDGGRGR